MRGGSLSGLVEALPKLYMTSLLRTSLWLNGHITVFTIRQVTAPGLLCYRRGALPNY